MSIIYKLDEQDEEAVQLLLTMLEKKVAQYEDYYIKYSIDWEDSLPKGVRSDDIMLDHIQIGSQTIGIFDRFIMLKRSIIECDLVKGDVYVYNLDEYDQDRLNIVFDNIAHTFRFAATIGLYNDWDATESSTMNTLLHGALLSFEQYNDVTLEEVDDILNWIGYTRDNHKELH